MIAPRLVALMAAMAFTAPFGIMDLDGARGRVRASRGSLRGLGRGSRSCSSPPPGIALLSASLAIRVAFNRGTSLPCLRLARALRASLIAGVVLSAAAAPAARAQEPSHEYRPELIVTLPRFHGAGLSVLEEQHLRTDAYTPVERQHGVTVLLPASPLGTPSLEMRQVVSGAGLVEHRYIPTLVQRLTLAGGLELRSRMRAELRDIAGTWSRRYQERVVLQRTVTVSGHDMQPYGHLDASYDSRYSALTRREAALGIRIPVMDGTSLDPFLMRQTDSHRAIPTIVATGLIMRVVL